MTENNKALIQIRDLTKSYNQITALKRLNLDLIPGQIIGLLGPVSYTHLSAGRSGSKGRRTVCGNQENHDGDSEYH